MRFDVQKARRRDFSATTGPCEFRNKVTSNSPAVRKKTRALPQGVDYSIVVLTIDSTSRISSANAVGKPLNNDYARPANCDPIEVPRNLREMR